MDSPQDQRSFSMNPEEPNEVLRKLVRSKFQYGGRRLEDHRIWQFLKRTRFGGWSQTKIAEYLDIPQSTVSRESLSPETRLKILIGSRVTRAELPPIPKEGEVAIAGFWRALKELQSLQTQRRVELSARECVFLIWLLKHRYMNSPDELKLRKLAAAAMELEITIPQAKILIDLWNDALEITANELSIDWNAEDQLELDAAEAVLLEVQEYGDHD